MTYLCRSDYRKVHYAHAFLILFKRSEAKITPRTASYSVMSPPIPLPVTRPPGIYDDGYCRILCRLPLIDGAYAAGWRFSRGARSIAGGRAFDELLRMLRCRDGGE